MEICTPDAVALDMQPSEKLPKYANHLPNEILYEILDYVAAGPKSQSHVATFCSVSRQWYDVGIESLYEEPYLVGASYGLLVRTVCPSVLAHIKRSSLAGLIKTLDLSHIVHQSTKSTTARLLNRTKPSLETFIAPQASFAISCWGALSKCVHLRILDLSLVSECISYEMLLSTLAKLRDLDELYLPRCSSNYSGAFNDAGAPMTIKWPPHLRHLQLSGSVHGRFMADVIRQPEPLPVTLSSLSISHCPGLSFAEIRSFLLLASPTLTRLALLNLPSIKPGRMNPVLDWCQNLKDLTISAETISATFGQMPEDFNSSRWREAKPLERLTLVTNNHATLQATFAYGAYGVLDNFFTAMDLFCLLDDRYLGRLRYVTVSPALEWGHIDRYPATGEDDDHDLGMVESALADLDRENWEQRRWHYEEFAGLYEDVSYDDWINTPIGRKIAAKVRTMRANE